MVFYLNEIKIIIEVGTWLWVLLPKATGLLWDFNSILGNKNGYVPVGKLLFVHYMQLSRKSIISYDYSFIPTKLIKKEK